MNKSTQRLLDKAAREAKRVIAEKHKIATLKKESIEGSDKYGVYGKPQGQPVNIHGGAFQRKDSEEDWARFKSRTPPVFSLDSSLKLKDCTRG